MMFHLTGGEWASHQCRDWFDALDKDRSGTISLDEFFDASLRDAHNLPGGVKLSLKAVFEEFDTNGSGQLEFAEFKLAAKKIGYGAVARELFDVFDADGSGSVWYEELTSIKSEEGQPVSQSAKSFLLAVLYRPTERKDGSVAAGLAAQESQQVGLAAFRPPPGSQEGREELIRLLASNESRLLELFTQWDRSRDGMLSESELLRALEAIGYSGAIVHATRMFEDMDEDSSGEIALEELIAFVKNASVELEEKLVAKRAAAAAGGGRPPLAAAQAAGATSVGGSPRPSSPPPANSPRHYRPPPPPTEAGSSHKPPSSATAGASSPSRVTVQLPSSPAKVSAQPLPPAATSAVAATPERASTSPPPAAAAAVGAAAAAAAAATDVATEGALSGSGGRGSASNARRRARPTSSPTRQGTRATLMHRIAPQPSEGLHHDKPKVVRQQSRIASHRPAPSLRRSPAGRVSPFSACPFASVELTGFGFAHNGMASLLFDKAAIKPRYLEFRGGGTEVRPRVGDQEDVEASMTLAMRNHAMHFNVADRNHDNQLDLAEFTELLHARMPQGMGGRPLDAETIKSWFDALDTNHSSTISMSEFFVFALGEALERTGAEGGLLSFFERWDVDGSQFISALELQSMAQKLGFGDVVDDLLGEIDSSRSRSITYQELITALRGHSSKARAGFRRRYIQSQRAADAAKAAPLAHGSNGSGDGSGDGSFSQLSQRAASFASAKSNAASLKAWLRSNASRVEEVFRLFDIDGDSSVGEGELSRATKFLGYETSKETVRELFHEIDTDGSRELTFNEISNWLEEDEESDEAATDAQAQAEATPRSGMRTAPSLKQQGIYVLGNYGSRYLPEGKKGADPLSAYPSPPTSYRSAPTRRSPAHVSRRLHLGPEGVLQAQQQTQQQLLQAQIQQQQRAQLKEQQKHFAHSGNGVVGTACRGTQSSASGTPHTSPRASARPGPRSFEGVYHRSAPDPHSRRPSGGVRVGWVA